MYVVQTWGEVFTNSLQNVWSGVAWFIPSVLIALIILIIGWVFASLIHRLIVAVFSALRIDNHLRAAGVEDIVRHSGYNLNSGHFIGSLVKWFIIVVFLIASLDVIGLSQVNEFLRDVVGYLPRVIVAVVILMVAVVVADVMKKVVIGSAKAAHVTSANFLGGVTKWAIWIFAILTALYHLGIAGALINTLLTGIVAAIAIALGLAFGLGGKDKAAEILQNFHRDLSDHR